MNTVILWLQVHPSESAYPLRPEVVESALALWAASGEPRYQRAGAGILHTISTYNSAPCGYCSVQNIASGVLQLALAVIPHAACPCASSMGALPLPYLP